MVGVPASLRNTLIVAIAVVGAVLVVLFGAWAIDSAAHSGQVMRNVDVDGEPVGGLTEDELRTTVERLAGEAARQQVEIVTPAASLRSTAGELGMDMDVAATVAAAMGAGRDESFLVRPFGWLGSTLRHHEVDPVYDTNQSALEAATAELVAANLTPPVEPSIAEEEGELVPVAGEGGQGIDLRDLGEQIAQGLRRGSSGDRPTIHVELSPVPMAPTAPDSAASELATRANELLSRDLEVSLDGSSATIAAGTLRSWARAVPTGTGDLRLSLDPVAIRTTLAEDMGDVGTPAVQLSWQVASDGTVSYTPGSDGTGCCAPDSADRIITALEGGQTSVRLDLTAVPPVHDAAWAESMKIVEPIASFTTNHACCESRVENIHRMADLVRGAVIAPGETFSINEHVGRRTTSKGFAEAGVIYAGEFTTDVGGGVSQFATTAFNAAFFAGLEIPEYMAHTIYISRYPYGREATLSYPAPDLKITNNTPFGVLLWPTYTGTSITVTLYSSPWVTGEQTGQSESPAGACTRVRTERTRTWLNDGHSETDYFSALYQPAEGVLC